MSKYHQIKGLRFENEEMILIVEAQERRFKLRSMYIILCKWP